MKVALGQINPTIGDFDGQPPPRARGRRPRPSAQGADAGRLPRAGALRLPAARPARAARLPRRGARRRSTALAAALAPARDGGASSGFPERLPRRPVGRGRRQQRRADRRRPGRRTSSASRCCRPTTCSTSGATSSPPPRSRRVAVPRPRARASRSARTSGTTPTSGRAASTARDPIETLVARRRRDHPQHLGLALHHREAPPAPAHAGGHRARAGGGRWCS